MKSTFVPKKPCKKCVKKQRIYLKQYVGLFTRTVLPTESMITNTTWLMANIGTIHKRRRQFFWIFDTPSPISSVLKYYPSAILINFCPSLLPIANVVYGRPHSGSLQQCAIACNASSQCKGFSYNILEQICTPKTSFLLSKIQPAENVISGGKELCEPWMTVYRQSYNIPSTRNTRNIDPMKGVYLFM